MSNSEVCDRHDDCLGRIHDKVSAIEITSASTNEKIEGFTNTVNSFLAEIRKDIYGKGGLIQETGEHKNQLLLQWGLLAAIFISGVIAFVFKK